MPKTVTKYDLLISCPSDVEEEISIINQTVTEFNKMFGEVYNIQIVTKHWSKDSYPQSGGKPQDLLNSQFVLNCDMAVAVFWTKFGTPTDEYGSGTEEEIEELLKLDKQVFLYFSDKAIRPSTFKSDQYKKVQSFRKKYEQRGIYNVYSDVEEFKKKFLNHLTLYFMQFLNNDENEKKSNSKFDSGLSLNVMLEGNVTEKYPIYTVQYHKLSFHSDLKSEINGLYQGVKAFNIKQNSSHLEEKPKSNGLNLGISGSILDGFSVRKVQLSNNLQDTIKNYADQNNINMESDFFSIGNLGEREIPNIVGMGSNIEIQGTKDEKDKYDLLIKLTKEINNYNQWQEYLKAIDSYYYLNLALSNMGTSFDEDIDVKVFVEKGSLLKVKELPIPGENILLIEGNAEKLPESIFVPESSHFVSEYTDYPIKDFSMSSLPSPLPRSRSEKLGTLKKKYNNAIDDIFIYDLYEDGDFDVLCLNYSYIKQYNYINFPTVLVFKNKPKKIKYEITAKHSPQKVEKELLFKEK